MTAPFDTDHVILEPVEQAPFRYRVSIAASPQAAGCLPIRISDVDRKESHELLLPARGHKDYKTFFTDLSRIFGLRALGAGTARPAVSDVAGQSSSFQLLLGQNIDPRILYGYGDPAVTRVPGSLPGEEDCYYLLVTSNDAPDAFPVLISRDLRDWKLTGFVFPRHAKPQWATHGPDDSDFWAPELHKAGGRYVVCYSARDRKDGGMAIGLAFANHPQGPYATADEPLLRGGVIDPHILADGARTYLYWKEDSNDVWPGLLTALMRERPDCIASLFAAEADRKTASLSVTLWPWVMILQPMERFFVQQTLIEAVAEDVPGFRELLRGLAASTPTRIVAQALRQILEALRTPIYVQELDCKSWQLTGPRGVALENDLAWEAHLVEGAWVTRIGSRYCMFYSGNDFSTPDYGIGVAFADSPLGPFIKHPEPIVGSTSEWSGPGHPSIAAGLNGSPRMFLHAFRSGDTGYKTFRTLLALDLASIRLWPFQF